MKNKINLGEIEGLKLNMLISLDGQAQQKGHGFVSIRSDDALKIAAALEALPKIVSALQILKDGIDYMEKEENGEYIIGERDKYLIDNILSQFETPEL